MVRRLPRLEGTHRVLASVAATCVQARLLAAVVFSWEERAAGYEGVADAAEPLPATGLGVVDVASEAWTRDEAFAVVEAAVGFCRLGPSSVGRGGWS